MKNDFDWSDVENIVKKSTVHYKNKFKATLDEFVEHLKLSPWMHAELKEAGISKVINVWSLITRPKYRLHEETIMMTFALYPNEAKLLGEDRIFKTEEDLYNYLKYFVKNTEFPRTVAEYEARFHEDIAGSLRTSSFNQFFKKDVPVNIANKDHIKLAKTYESGKRDRLEIPVVVEDVVGFIGYNPLTKYKFLESCGYGLSEISINNPNKKSKELLINGIPICSRDLQD